MKYYTCINFDGWNCPDSCEGCMKKNMKTTKEGKLIIKFISDLRNLKYIDLSKNEGDLPEFWIKVFDVSNLILKYQKELMKK